MTVADISARVRRLDQLSRGLALEISNVSKADDPMLYVERQAYLTAMRRTLTGIETHSSRWQKQGSGLSVDREHCEGPRSELGHGRFLKASRFLSRAGVNRPLDTGCVPGRRTSLTGLGSLQRGLLQRSVRRRIFLEREQLSIYHLNQQFGCPRRPSFHFSMQARPYPPAEGV